jgi:5'-3' exonuclease
MDSIVIAIDGVSPYAKMILQRKRRKDDTYNPKKLNAVELTPGTQLIEKIDAFIKEYIKLRNKENEFLSTKYIYLDSKKHGEGELKIINHILKTDKKSHLIVSNDSDLVLMSVATHIKYIYILVNNKNSKNIVSIDEIVKNASNDDFVFISLMVGNDYFNKLKYVSFDSLWKGYHTFRKYHDIPIIENCNINFDGLSELMLYIVRFLPKRNYKVFVHKRYNEDRVKKYLECITWCMSMYSKGKCPMQEYTYDPIVTPTPLDIIYYCYTCKNGNVQVPKSDTKPLSNDIYPLLVMPKAAVNLIPKDYHKYVNKELKHIYDDNYKFTKKDIDYILSFNVTYV